MTRLSISKRPHKKTGRVAKLRRQERALERQHFQKEKAMIAYRTMTEHEDEGSENLSGEELLTEIFTGETRLSDSLETS